MALASQPPALNFNMALKPPSTSNGFRPSAPSFNLNMALAPQFPMINFIAGHNHCHTVDTAMGMGVHNIQHTIATHGH